MIGDAQVRRTDPFVTTKIGEGDAVLVTGVVPAAAFRDAAVTTVPAPELYAGAVAEAVRRVETGELRKVVLARTIEVAGDHRFDPRRLAHRLRAVDPHAFSFIAPADGGTLVGATPELLVSRQGSEVRANPLAGSAPRSGDRVQDQANADALAASAKNREEHAIVVDAVAEALRPLCATLAWDPEPVLLETANVWHLSTRFRGRLADPAPSALDLALALHPTPAVAGAPTEVARAAIGQLEGFDRGATRVPSGGWTPTGTGCGRSRCGARSFRGTARPCTRGPGSSVAVSPPRSWTRPTGSSARSSTRCAGGDAMRLLHAGDDAKGWLDGPWLSDLTIAIGYATRAIDEPHTHDRSTEIYLIAAGTAIAVVDGTELELEAGDVLIVAPHEVRTIVSASPDYRCFVLATGGEGTPDKRPGPAGGSSRSHD